MPPRRPGSRRRAVVRAAVLAVAVCWPAVAPRAQSAAAGDERPIQIQADSGIEWHQNAKVYVARGNAVAARGDTEVHADTLVAHYREGKPGGQTSANSLTGNTEIYRVDADGHVVLKRNGQVMTGDHAIYDVDQGVGVITGKSLKLTTANEVVTARDAFDWYDQKQIAVARGDAVATRNGKTVRADILTGYMARTVPAPGKPGAAGARPAAAKPAGAAGPDPNSKLSRIDAQGHVVVTNGPEVGQGDYGIYNAETGIVTLIGHVVLAREKNVLTGQSAVMDLNTNVSRIMPVIAGEPGKPQRVQGLLVRRDSPAAAANPGKKP